MKEHKATSGKVGVGVRYDGAAVRTRNPAFDDGGSFVDLEPLLRARWPRLRSVRWCRRPGR